VTRGPGQVSIGPAHRANTVARLIRRHPVLSALTALVLAGAVAAPNSKRTAQLGPRIPPAVRSVTRSEV